MDENLKTKSQLNLKKTAVQSMVGASAIIALSGVAWVVFDLIGFLIRMSGFNLWVAGNDFMIGLMNFGTLVVLLMCLLTALTIFSSTRRSDNKKSAQIK